MAVGFPTKVNYVDGDVLSAANMNDLSGTVNLVNGTQYSAGKNSVLNSAFNVWQRGTSVAVSASSTPYTADRWQMIVGANQAYTVARTATSDSTNLPFIQYCARVQRNSGQTGTGTIGFGQSFESINSIPLAGKTVTLSFYARKGANYSPTSNALVVYLATGTGTDQNVIVGGFTGQTLAVNQTATLTATWQRFTYTATLGSTVTQAAVEFLSSPTGTAGTNDYFEITGVQLEASTVASAFSTNGGTYEAELAACLRYYQQTGANPLWSGNVTNASTYYMTSQLPVVMRSAPTCSFTITNNNGFPATNPAASTITSSTIWCTAVANTTGSAGFFGFTYTASAEL